MSKHDRNNPPPPSADRLRAATARLRDTLGLVEARRPARPGERLSDALIEEGVAPALARRLGELVEAWLDIAVHFRPKARARMLRSALSSTGAITQAAIDWIVVWVDEEIELKEGRC